MPLPRIRTLFLLLCLFAVLCTLCYLSVTALQPSASHRHASSWLPGISSAVISLTDDNSTFFISRPAAFGPPLPKLGMDGELFVLDDSQLACDDTPGWDPSAVALPTHLPTPLWPGEVDDGTDDLLNPVVPTPRTSGNNPTTAPAAKVEPPSGHADIQTLQQMTEISGKIVLVARGGCGFLEKVLWAQRRGGVALIVGDYKRSGIGAGAGGLVTMYAKGDTSNVSIPSLFTSHTTAQLLTTLLPDTADDSAMAPPSRPTTGGREGLWITLTPTSMSSSPFFDTLLVLVVSPLVTLSIVYTLLLIRSRIRRRRWRAPKSVVERLPVRTYQTMPPSPPPSRAPPSPPTSSPAPHPPRSSSLRPPPTGSRARTPSASGEKSLSPRRGDTPRCNGRCDRPRPYLSGSSECVVCLEEYIDGVSQVMKLPCGHEFHVGCITPWLTTRRRTCPICKGDVVRGAMASSSSMSAAAAADGADETTPLVLDTTGFAEDDDEVDLERGQR